MVQPIGILAAMDEELAILRQEIQKPVVSEHGGVQFVEGTLNGHPVVVGQCGIGKVNAAMATTLMHILFSPSSILNTGTAGGLRDDFEVGDIVLGESVCHHDVDATAFGYAYGQVPREPARFSADTLLLEAGVKAGRRLSEVHVHTGLIASGDIFLSDETARSIVRDRFKGVFAVEMEAAAIAQVCHHFDIPCLIVRAVSDLAGGDARITHEEFLHLAADSSAHLVMSMIDELNLSHLHTRP